ncbi:hypothetical protein Pelo_6143 [Pelomyxa schiedti]|nr:hypothetical protein Pelo_6143 [Pelomyxa schiedti]
MGTEPILSEEFWSERGVFKLTHELCAIGNLDVLKWILSSFFQINEGNKFMLYPFVHEASQNGQIEVIKWLVDTFQLSDIPEFGADFRPGASGSVYDVKRFVESFPEWEFDGLQLALTAALFKGPSSADEIIEVCRWLTNRFSLCWADFIGDWTVVGLPQYPEVMKWILSDVTEESDIILIWNMACSELSNIELGKWFIEEKGITPTQADFMTACSSTRDNLAFIEWLYKQVSVSSSDLLSSLHMALSHKNESNSRWLEQTYISTTNSRPQISLVTLSEMCNLSVDEDWLEWLFTHTSMCDIDCSETELVKFVNECIERNQLHCALSAWERFSLSPIIHCDLLLRLLKELLVCGSLSQVKQVASIGGFTPSEIWNCMSHCSLQPECSEIVKWLVKECTRNISDPPVIIAENSGCPSTASMFAKMIRDNKRGCLQWLFNRFHITLPDVLGKLGNGADLATWKLLLRLLPEITREVATQHFMHIVTASPLHSQFSINRLGVTLNDIQSCDYDNSVTRHWLPWALESND